MKYKRHNYEYDIDTESMTAPAHVVRLVGRNKRVLEIGCGPGSITKILFQQGACQVTGLEVDPEAIAKVTPYCVKVMPGDLNSPEWPRLLDGSEGFDVVVAADVLEHLYNPIETLRRMAPLIHSSGYLVISLPHICHAGVMSCMMVGDFRYGDWGLLDRTHIRFFGLKNIEDLFAQAGLKIVEAKFVTKPPEETEFATVWASLSREVQGALMSSKQSEVYQVVVKAVPVSFQGDGVSLIPPKRDSRRPFVLCTRSWRARLGQSLSPVLKHRIRNALSRIGINV